MLKRVWLLFVLVAFFTQVSFAGDSGVVKIIAVNKASWKIETTEHKEKGTSGGGAAAGAIGGLAWMGGPLGLAAGAWLGNHLEKNISGKKGTGKTTTEIIQGYRIKLDTGESLKTLVKYRVGQKIHRNEISEEK